MPLSFCFAGTNSQTKVLLPGTMQLVGATVGGDDHRAAAMALAHDLERVAALGRIHGVEAEVVDDGEVDTDQLAELGLVAVVEARVAQRLGMR